MMPSLTIQPTETVADVIRRFGETWPGLVLEVHMPSTAYFKEGYPDPRDPQAPISAYLEHRAESVELTGSMTVLQAHNAVVHRFGVEFEIGPHARPGSTLDGLVAALVDGPTPSA